MRTLIDWLMLSAVLLGAAYLAYTHQPEARWLVRDVQNRISPCSRPVTYSIGSIDPRFGISTTTLIARLEDAEIIWETPSGKDLFAYMPSHGTVTVNLVYDDRQASTDTLKKLGIETGQDQASYEALKARYDALASKLSSKQSGYDNQVARYKQHQDAYNREVQRWNEKGGAPASVYAELQNQKMALASEFAAVKRVEETVNEDVVTLNALATTLNQLIVQLNLKVAQYNSVGAAAGEFEEGEYRLSRGVETIDIYEYSDRTRLVRVLAHEMGHALGLDHVSDADSIMYQINSSRRLTLSVDDMSELSRACRSKTI